MSSLSFVGTSVFCSQLSCVDTVPITQSDCCVCSTCGHHNIMMMFSSANSNDIYIGQAANSFSSDGIRIRSARLQTTVKECFRANNLTPAHKLKLREK